ncbi:MAG: M20/M25/M40 family metallo-hydrolase, partial [Rhodospirillales bacterium]
MMDDTRRSRILETLVARRAGQFRLLSDLVRIRSENPPGDMAAVSGLTAAALKALDFGVERHAVPDERAAEDGMTGVANLVVRHEFAAGPVVALSAFGDTGPAGDGWTRDPFDPVIEGGVLTGLGAVTKADLAVYAHALAGLRDAGPDLSGTVELHVTFDGAGEGDLGPKWLLENGIVNPDYVVASGFSYGVGTSAMGDLQMEVALAAMAPAGAAAAGDPMQAASRVLGALYGLAEDYGGVRSSIPGIGSPTLVVGQVQGGARPDRAPDEVVLRLDRRLIPDEDPAAAEEELTRIIAETASQEPDVVCRVRRLRLAPPMKPG